MPTSLAHLIQTVLEGEPVKAGVVNRAVNQLNVNANIIWKALQAASIGSTIYSYLQPVEPDVVAGMPVYFNTLRQRYERGLAQMDSTPGLGLPVLGEKGRIWGVVTLKHSTTTADILLYGYAELDISAAVGGTVTAGDYYLSGVTPGGLIKQRQPVSVPVLRADGNGHVMVMPQFVDFVDRHVHYKFDLVCRPAGTTTPPASGDRHVITNPEPDAQGWLPADHAVFAGKAPAGAAFGYNLSQHAALDNAWPPLPASNGVVEWNKGTDKDVGYTQVPLGVNELCVLDSNGIWWMSDAYGDVPWPIWYDSETYVSESLSTSASIESPRDLNMLMQLWFTKLQFATDTMVVTSLESADGLLSITCLDGVTPAKAGALKIKLNLGLLVEDGSVGYQFLTGLDGSKFLRGYGARGVYAASANVTLNGEATSRLVPGDVTTPMVYHGNVGIAVSLQPTLELTTQMIRVDGVEDAQLFDILYLTFPAARQSEYRGRIDVPGDVQLANPQMQLRFRVLGRIAGTLPALSLTVRRLPYAANDDGPVPTALPGDGEEDAVVLDTEIELDDTNQYVDVVSAAFEVAAGDQVFYTIQRLATDGYAAEVGLLEQKGVLSSA